jgi:hypothetical protein
MARRQPRTLLEVAMAQVGMRRGARVIAFMIAWNVVRRELGHEPTIEEYGDWWKVSRATAFREQQMFREAFPGEENPARLMDAAAGAWDERKGVRGLGSVPVPA